MESGEGILQETKEEGVHLENRERGTFGKMPRVQTQVSKDERQSRAFISSSKINGLCKTSNLHKTLGKMYYTLVTFLLCDKTPGPRHLIEDSI